LKWFDAERRRENVVSRVVEALRSAGLVTDPDFRTTDYSERIAFYPIAPSHPVETDTMKPVLSLPIELDFSSALTGEAREAGREGTESSGAANGTENPASTNRLRKYVSEKT